MPANFGLLQPILHRLGIANRESAPAGGQLHLDLQRFELASVYQTGSSTVGESGPGNSRSLMPRQAISSWPTVSSQLASVFAGFGLVIEAV